MKQFSLRELFLLVFACACACGWWIERRDKRREFNNLKNITLEMGKYAYDEYGMESGFSEKSGNLYINGKRIWSLYPTDSPYFPMNSEDNGGRNKWPPH